MQDSASLHVSAVVVWRFRTAVAGAVLFTGILTAAGAETCLDASPGNSPAGKGRCPNSSHQRLPRQPRYQLALRPRQCLFSCTSCQRQPSGTWHQLLLCRSRQRPWSPAQAVAYIKPAPVVMCVASALAVSCVAPTPTYTPQCQRSSTESQCHWSSASCRRIMHGTSSRSARRVSISGRAHRASACGRVHRATACGLVRRAGDCGVTRGKLRSPCQRLRSRPCVCASVRIRSDGACRETRGTSSRCVHRANARGRLHRAGAYRVKLQLCTPRQRHWLSTSRLRPPCQTMHLLQQCTSRQRQ